MQEELRQTPRRKVLKQGKIVTANPITIIDVVICDLSAGGARLRVPASARLPERFGLAVTAESLVYPAAVRWQKGEEMGVEFIGEPSRTKSRNWQPAAISTPSTAEANSKEIRFNLTDRALLNSSGLQPAFDLRYAPLVTHPGRGLCIVDVLIFNCGAVPAHHPFFCLPALGLNVNPAQGWVKQIIQSPRKLWRFVHSNSLGIDPDAAIHCCSIELTFKAACGGRLEFELGSEHALWQLPDLKLTCIVGSGNYPPERVPFRVPAAQLVACVKEGEIEANKAVHAIDPVAE